MKRTTPLWGLLPLLLLIMTCAAPRYASPIEATDTARLCFGRGGGYTGLVSEYTLLPNGQIFKKGPDKTPSYTELRGVKKDQARQAFNNYEVLQLAELDFRHPGNLYYYIRYENKDEQHEIVWGDEQLKVDSKAKLFYNILAAMVKDQQ
ncbi:MAG: hypothetical protein AAGG75_08785 [Bacteroidota bacterium]